MEKKKKVFISITSLLIFIVASFFVWSLSASFNGGGGFNKYLWPAIFAVILGVFFSFGWLLSYSKKRSGFFAFLIVLPFLIFFIKEPIILAVGLVAAFTFWLAWWRGTGEKEVSFKISLSKILRSGLPIFFTGLALMIASFYYWANTEQVKQGNFEVLQEGKSLALIGDLVLKAVVGQGADDISFNLSVDKFISAIIEKQSGLKPGSGPWQESFQSGIDKFKQELNQTYGLNLKGGETVSSVIRIFINQKINSALGPYKKYIPLLFAVAMFLTLKAVGFLYVWIVVFLSWLLYKLLLLLRIIRLGKEMAEKEFIIL